MSTVDTARLHEIADSAQAAAELAMNRIEYPANHVDQAIRDEAYAAGVEDVLRYLTGDAAPTEELALVLRAGRSEELAAQDERCSGSGLVQKTGGEWRCPSCGRTILAEAGIHPDPPRLIPHNVRTQRKEGIAMTAPTGNTVNWQDVYADVDGVAPRLTTVIDVTVETAEGTQVVPVRLTAICVTNVAEPGRPDDVTQEVVNAEDVSDVEAMYMLNGEDGPLQAVTIGGIGDNRPYVIFGVQAY